MGACGSSTRIESAIPAGWMELFIALKLTRSDIRKMYKMYKTVDLDDSGSVDTVELLTLLDIERTRFTEHIFTIFDSDGSGKVDFREFVLSLWNYCTIGPGSLEIFTFDLFDVDASGELSAEEVSQMLKDIYGKKHANDPKIKIAQAELRKIDGKTGMNLTSFKKFTQHHHGVMFPAFQLQHQLQRSVLGVGFWHRASERRVQLSKGKYVTLSELMRMHLNQGLYDRAVSESNILRMSSNARLIIKTTGTNQRRQSTDLPHSRNIGPPPTIDNTTEPPPLTQGDHHADASPSCPPPRRGSTSSAHPPLHGGPAHSTATAGSNSTVTSPDLHHGFGSSFSLGGTDHHHAGSNSKSTASSKKEHHNHHSHNQRHHTSVLKSTAAAADDSDQYFKNSTKSKPVHATGHHQSDVNVVAKRRKSVNPDA